MSGFDSLVVGISGLMAQAAKLGTISDNIANINTVGYKKSDALFRSLLGHDVVTSYTPGGASNITRHLNNSQGIITNTSSPTDIAISGSGFFAVKQTAIGSTDLFYTRAGGFVADKNGDFVNVAGYFLQGWLLDEEQLPSGLDTAMVDSSTGRTALQTVNLLTLTDIAVPTTEVSVKANLTASKANYSGTPAYDSTDSLANMADGGVSPIFTRPLTIVDSEGAEHDLTIGFLKTAPNTWAIEIYANDAAELGATSAQVASGTATFNGDGSLASISGSITTAVSISWATPDPATNSITFNWGTAGPIDTGDIDGLEQFDGPYHSSAEQNGFSAGSLRSVTINSDGFVLGNYDNGVSRKLFMIPLVNLTEPSQLQSLSGNVYAQTVLSGDENFVQPNNGFGTLYSSALESSNVDVSTEFSNMIVAQRAYQFNTRVISTVDDMLKTMNDALG